MPVPEDWFSNFTAEVERWKSNPAAQEYIGDRPFKKFIFVEQAKDWNDFIKWTDELSGEWCFRGQRESEWLLATSLDRFVRRERSGKDPEGYEFAGYYHLDRETEQRELVFRFQQQAHTYLRTLPSADDLGSWLALMQHHGTPTRLLDWTESPNVAAYFALEEIAQGQMSAVWAIDTNWLTTAASASIPGDGPNLLLMNKTERADWVNRVLTETALAVIRVDPLLTDERMAAQQGVLLCKLFHEASFSQMLMSMMIYASVPRRPVVRKLEIGVNNRIQFLKRLRTMNIHRASLFPGLDGFAQSLKLLLETKGHLENP